VKDDNGLKLPSRKIKNRLNSKNTTSSICFRILFVLALYLKRSRDSSAGIATGYGMGDREVRVRVEGKKFSLLHVVQTGSGAHPDSNPMGTVGSFPGNKETGA
jgi:hypothetical protein